MPRHEITLIVNGIEETPVVEARELLIHTLRDELGYTGPKIGCETAQCGACTVELDARVVKACNILSVQADGSTITTIGGLPQTGEVETLLEAFHDEHALQCGYCTPGMVMRTREFLRTTEEPTREEIRHALKGNLCRCTGYSNVVDAVQNAAGEGTGTE